MSDTPNLDKMGQVHEFSQPLGEFLDWLNNADGLRLCTFENGKWEPVYVGLQRLLARYFGVDLDAAERERMSVLASVRALNLERELRR